MTNKFSFYLSAPSVGAETQKEVQKPSGLDGDTFEESFSASSSDDKGPAAAVHHGVPQSKSDDVTEEAVVDREVAAGDDTPSDVKQAVSKAKEEAGDLEAKKEEKCEGLAEDDSKEKSDAEDGEVAPGDETPSDVKQAVSKAKEAVGGLEVKTEEKREKVAEDDSKEKNDAEDGELAAGDENSSDVKQVVYKTKEAAGGLEAEKVEKCEEATEDDSREKRDAEATQQGHDVTQSDSSISEVTYEECAPSLAASSTSSAPTGACNDQDVLKVSNGEVTMPPEASVVSRGIASMMSERIRALDKIRGLLKKEHEQESEVCAEVSAKIRVLEDDLASKHGSISDLKTKNADYEKQLGHMSSMVNELVDTNQGNTTQIAKLEQDVASKTDTIKEMKRDIKGRQSTLEQKIDENVLLLTQLQMFKTQNKDLKLTVEDLEAKNTNYGNELENLMSSVHELVEHNTALEGQVAELIDANKKLEAVLISTKKEKTGILGTVDSLTASLDAANARRKKEAEELQKEIEATRQTMKQEQDANALAVQQLEKIIEDTKVEMSERLLAQKGTFNKQVVGLTNTLEEARKSIEKKSESNETLQKEIENIGRSAAKSAEDAATTISQLEKDLEEEFQITNQLKQGMEDLRKKTQKDQDCKYTDDMEAMMSSLRMIQCWQLSHFQRINKLVSENKDRAKGIERFSP